MPDMDVDRSRVAEILVAPDLFQKLLTTENLARIFGNLAVFVDPNAAQVAHEYADTISDRLKKEQDAAVQTGVLVKVDGWDINLPPPADVTAKINAVPPLKLPPLPEISRDATAKE